MTAPPVERIAIVVEDVDLANRAVHGRDKTNAPIMAAIRDTSAAFRVPVTGDRWVCVRYGYQWILEHKIDSAAEHAALQALQPGDARLVADGKLVITATGYEINSLPAGALVYDSFSGNGVQTVFTLTAAPVANATVQAYSVGSLISPSGWTRSGKALTFTSPPATGTLIVYYQRL